MLRDQKPKVAISVSIWDWNMEAELGKIVLMTSGQPPGKARSSMFCLTLLWSRHWARDIRGVFQPQPFCDGVPCVMPQDELRRDGGGQGMKISLFQ